jgi:hypothetical protein
VYPPPVLGGGGGRRVGGQYFGRRETYDCPVTVIISLRLYWISGLVLNGQSGGRAADPRLLHSFSL